MKKAILAEIELLKKQIEMCEIECARAGKGLLCAYNDGKAEGLRSAIVSLEVLLARL
jgi:hypothetical protein